ncbi:MAG: 4-hydroxy-3-methylbut-2-en-1-yl diphosphate synthase [Stappiaceae bacterium]
MFSLLLKRTWYLATAHLSTLLRVSWAYLLLLLAINIYLSGVLQPSGGFQTGSYMTEPLEGSDLSLRSLGILANLIIGLSIAIAYTRRLLIDAQDFFVSFGIRHIKVAGLQILLAIMGLALMFPLGIIALFSGMFLGPFAIFIGLAMPFVALMIIQRFSLVLPAAAIDDTMSLRDSWHATQGMGWAMAFNAAIAMLAAGCMVVALFVFFELAERFLFPDALFAQFRSAILPMATMLTMVWIFANIHTTCYAIAREKFANKILGARQAEQARLQYEATRALNVANHLKKS